MAAHAYHRLAGIDDLGSHIKAYPYPTEVAVFSVFGPKLTEGVLKENDHCCAELERLQETWPAVCDIIREIPADEELRKLHMDAGMKITLNDIGVAENLSSLLLQYSPYVRNRLTLMRIRQMICLG